MTVCLKKTGLRFGLGFSLRMKPSQVRFSAFPLQSCCRRFCSNSNSTKLSQMNEEFSDPNCIEKFTDFSKRHPSLLLDPFLKHANVKPGEDDVLDVACGPGITTVNLAKQSPKKVIGIDIAEGMLEKAKQFAVEQSVVTSDDSSSSLITFQRCNAEEIPFESESFSLVTQRLGFHHFTQYERVFAEMARVCRKGGRIVILDITTESDNNMVDDSEVTPSLRILHNSIQALRDPTHAQCLLDSEIELMMSENGIVQFEIAEKLTHESSLRVWLEKTGRIQERWAVMPLAHALCDLEIDTGMKLRVNPEDDSDLLFTHNYRVWKGVKM